MEQYGPRLCLRLDSVRKQNNEKAEDVFKYWKDLIEEVSDLEILEPVIDRAHNIGPDYADKKCWKCVSLSFYNLLSSYNNLQSLKVYWKQSTG